MADINKNNLILTGLGASPGIAQGKVKIIAKDSDYRNFNQGDILVTKITDPSMVMMMSKASAIITDIGGLTSHPAIVAREMGIPCVVATKEATTKLKDGIKIMVDGQTGKIYLTEEKYNNSEQDYADLMKAYAKAFATMDISTFDISTDYTKLDPLIANSWLKKIFAIIAEAKKQNLTNKEIGGLLYSPSVIRDIAIFDLFMASIAKLPKKKKLELADFYINILKATCLKDPFALNGNNLIHNSEEIKQAVSQVNPGSPEQAKKLGRLINACYNLSYSLYGDMNPQILYENYGPYYIRDKFDQRYMVIIKEFKNLKPIEIWPAIKNLPFKTIKIISIYQNVKFTIDAITHTNYQGDVINNLKYYALYVDNRLTPIEKIDKTTNLIEKYSCFIWSIFKKLDLEKFKILYLWQKAYNYRLLCKKLGLNWEPSQEIIAEIRKKPLKQWPKFKTGEAAINFFLNIIDPRTDFNG